MKRLTRHHDAGQSAAELAIFGSIVIFVIGLILRASLSMSQRSHMDLRAFRIAMQESYRTAQGEYTDPKHQFSAARNNSYLILLEDRLAIDPSQKQGTRERTPLMAQASGTLSHTLMMPAKPGNEWNDPVVDFFVNGQRFPLSTSRYITKTMEDLRNSGDIVACNTQGYGPDTGTCYEEKPSGSGNYKYTFFRKVYNGEEDDEDTFDSWCASGCSADWPAERRFDLNFDGTPEVADTAEFPYNAGVANTRQYFSWQWGRIPEGELKDDMQVDMDGDWREERVVKIIKEAGQITKLEVVDQQGGDIDLTSDETEGEPGPLRTPGIQPDVRMYSVTHDGTYLENREGRLYSVDGRFIRNETRQDHLDIIERVLYLSNDTGRFCSQGGGGTPCTSDLCEPTKWENPLYAAPRGLLGLPGGNPVERCGNCFSDAHMKYTCMDRTTSGGPTIFIRSRIRDRRRSKWITRTAD